MRRLAAGLMMLLCSGGLFAQILSSSADMREHKGHDALVTGASELKRIGACLVRKDRAQAIRHLESAPGAEDESGTAAELFNRFESCMSLRYNPMRVQDDQLRGALAEALFLQSDPAVYQFKNAKVAYFPLPQSWLQGSITDKQKPKLIAQDFADCVVSRDPDASAAVLRTNPQGPEERLAINKLVPLFGPCLAKGATFRMDMASIRSLLAQALYRGVQIWKPLTSGDAVGEKAQ